MSIERNETKLSGGAMSVDDHEGVLLLRYQEYSHGAVITTEIEIPAFQIPSLMQRVVNHGMYALTHVAESLARGDCDRCGNVRLIEVPATVGTTQVYCPDCNPAGGSSVGLRDYPRVHPVEKGGS